MAPVEAPVAFAWFGAPAALFLLLLVPLVIWLCIRRRPAALHFGQTRLLAKLPTGRSRRVRLLRHVFTSLSLTLIILAASEPHWPDFQTPVERRGIALIMAVDVSGSMAEIDLPWEGQKISRLDAVKRVFSILVAGGQTPSGETLPGRPNDLIGLVTFGTRPESPCPLTLSHDALLTILEQQQPRRIPDESQTNIGDAILWSLYRLESAGKLRKVIILLSDGEHNVPPPAWKPRQSAQLAANMGVTIYTIRAVGKGETKVSEGKEAPASKEPAGEKSLEAVAYLTGGRYFTLEEGANLLEIGRDIDLLERKQIEGIEYRRYYELAPLLGWGALLVLVTAALMERSRWFGLP